MKRTLLLLLISLWSFCFSFDLYIGDKLIYSSADLQNTMSWSSFVSFFEEYTKILGIDSPSTGQIGDFQYLVWAGHTIGFDKNADVFIIDGITKKSKVVPFKDILSAFQLLFIEQESKIVLPDMVIDKVSQMGDIIEITYEGINRLVFKQEEGLITVLSKGYVIANGSVYKPGQLVQSLPTDRKIEQEIQMPGLIRLVLVPEGFSYHNLVVARLGQSLEASKSDVVVFYSNGDDRIIIRPYAPEFEGSDWPFYAHTKRIAQQLAVRFDLKLEICPIYDLPVGKIAMVLLLSDEQRLLEIEEYLKELLR
ncbi:DUF4941 domain-containing protein [Pseudothermotoga sp. U03pept]|uniref:DUF4941 domain-containing protein n=1 Tax=Pseudothermotoga sp. U03pept TaxID=3447012 RepID=UPI003F058BB9